ncbi:hypothetical protein RLQ86_004702, partial [Salmonella enterica subsp. enterica serovar Tucson]|nr:hypothetical protein [Salmonella enterica subsp. enterica serovar Tucson]
MDESRKAFEHWALEIMQFTPDDLTWDEKRNCYRDYVSHMAWKGWQASRAAIELDIDWPESNDDFWKDGEEGAYAMGHEDGKDKTTIAVMKAIRAAGIKVKE